VNISLEITWSQLCEKMEEFETNLALSIFEVEGQVGCVKNKTRVLLKLKTFLSLEVYRNQND